MGHPNYAKYEYCGPVEEFGKCIAHRWTGTTFAPSAEKARSNLTYQYKRDHNKIPNTKITLPGKVVMVGREESA